MIRMSKPVKLSSWWYTALLVGLLALTAFIIWSEITHSWPLLSGALVLILAGYSLIRPRLNLEYENAATAGQIIGSVLLMSGVALGSYVVSIVSLLLAVACPVVWTVFPGFRAGAISNIVLIAVVALAAGAGSFSRGTLTLDWTPILVGTLVIMIFSLMIGSMVHTAVRWGRERADLLDDLRSSQADLGESYRQLMAVDLPTGAADQRPLSSREAEVLTLASQGYSNREIGERLFISPATVKTHMEHILAKLDATTRTQAVLIAHQSGLLSGRA